MISFIVAFDATPNILYRLFSSAASTKILFHADIDDGDDDGDDDNDIIKIMSSSREIPQ